MTVEWAEVGQRSLKGCDLPSLIQSGTRYISLLKSSFNSEFREKAGLSSQVEKTKVIV